MTGCVVAIDVGGTFTDIALADLEAGQLWTTKTPTTQTMRLRMRSSGLVVVERRVLTQFSRLLVRPQQPGGVVNADEERRAFFGAVGEQGVMQSVGVAAVLVSLADQQFPEPERGIQGHCDDRQPDRVGERVRRSTENR